MEAVGYDMYLRLLSEAVAEKKGETPEVRSTAECLVDIQLEAHIPEDYIENLSQRLDIYRKIASVRNESDSSDLIDELIDRFGDPPDAVKGLIDVALLRNTAAQFGFKEITQKGQMLHLIPEKLDVNVAAMINMYMKGRCIVVSGPGALYRRQDRGERDGYPPGGHEDAAEIPFRGFYAASGEIIGGIDMKALQTLPPGYREIYRVDLQKDKKTALFVNGLALLIAAVMGVGMNRLVPISSLFQMDGGPLLYGLRFVSLFVLIFGYLILHELVHGITMKACGTKKVRYGFTGLYCYAGSEDYYGKKSYLTIALAPVVLFFFLLIPINLIVPREWFWVVYFLQIGNLSGAAGDLFVTVKFAGMPKDILVQDSGVSMAVYSRSGKKDTP